MAESNANADMQKLLEVWKVLETLTVSSRRMGEFWLAYGEEAAKDALHEYMTQRFSTESRTHADSSSS
jgi:hypothetical protein